MVYDRLREVTVLFGGEDMTHRQDETWEWDGTDWTLRTPLHSPQVREEAGMVFDETTNQMVLFGGWDIGHYNDTWYYSTSPVAQAVSYGAGCQGSAAVTPDLQTIGLPWLGESYVLALSGMPAPYAATLHVGMGQSSIPLDGVGMPGCVMLTVPFIALSMSGSAGSAMLVVPMPADPNLIGFPIDSQAIVLAPGANLLGAIASNGLELIGGMK
jgi:hypothetical protein